MDWIDISHGMRGWFAVHMTDIDGFPEPEQTSPISCRTREEAILDARQWAAAEGLRVARDLIQNEDE